MTSDSVPVSYCDAAIALEVESIDPHVSGLIENWDRPSELYVLGGSESCFVFDSIGDNEVIKITRCRATIELFKRLRDKPVLGLPAVQDYLGECAWTGKHKQTMEAFVMTKYSSNVQRSHALYKPAGDLRMALSKGDPQCANTSLNNIKSASASCVAEIQLLNWQCAIDALADFFKSNAGKPFAIDLPIDNWFIENNQMINVDPVATAD